jgi:chitin synthase
MSSDKDQSPESDGLVTSWISALIFGGDESKLRPSSMEPSTNKSSSNTALSPQPQRPLSSSIPGDPLYPYNQASRQPRPLPMSPPPAIVAASNNYPSPPSMLTSPYYHPLPSVATDIPQLTSPFNPALVSHPLPNPPQEGRFPSLYDSDATLHTTMSMDLNNNNNDNNSEKPYIDINDIDDTQQQITTDENDSQGVSISTKYYGRAPLRTARRYATKRMQLTRGNLVLENAVPMTLLSQVPRKDDHEFKKIRYTAATCDPDDFVDAGFKLRQQLNAPRDTEIHIVITMYNVSII